MNQAIVIIIEIIEDWLEKRKSFCFFEFFEPKRKKNNRQKHGESQKSHDFFEKKKKKSKKEKKSRSKFRFKKEQIIELFIQ